MEKAVTVVIAGVAAVVVLMLVYVWSAGGFAGTPEETPTPEPKTTVSAEAPADGEAEESDDEHADDEHAHEEDGEITDEHGHGEYVDESSCDGPVWFEQCGEFEYIEPDDAQVAQKLGDTYALAFLEEWFTFSSDEDPARRVKRLVAAGATEELAHTFSIVAREDTTLSSLKAETRYREGGLIIPITMDDDQYVVSVSVAANGEYTFAGGSFSQLRFSGSVRLWFTADGTITRVVEDFPVDPR